MNFEFPTENRNRKSSISIGKPQHVSNQPRKNPFINCVDIWNRKIFLFWEVKIGKGCRIAWAVSIGKLSLVICFPFFLLSSFQCSILFYFILGFFRKHLSKPFFVMSLYRRFAKWRDSGGSPFGGIQFWGFSEIFQKKLPRNLTKFSKKTPIFAKTHKESPSPSLPSKLEQYSWSNKSPTSLLYF